MNEILMQSVLNTLNRGPMTMASIIIAVGYHPKEVRPVVGELLNRGRIEQQKRLGTIQYLRTDRYRNSGGNNPGPEAA